MQAAIFLQAALNGDRIHPAAPRNPTAIAEAARAAVDAGAHSVHVHAFDDAAGETLQGAACARVLRAIRALCPDCPDFVDNVGGDCLGSRRASQNRRGMGGIA